MILITGATGNVGREIVRELDARGAGFRVLVRDPTRATGLPERVERVVGDFAKAATLGPAFDGVERVFLLTQGIGTEYTAHALAAAKAAHVSHIVHLSSYSVAYYADLGHPMPAMARWHHDREEMIRASGVPATFLRPGGFMTNVLDWLPTIREGGYVVDAIGPGRFASIDPADIGAVAALVLSEDGHQGKAYGLTGDELFTVREQVRILAKAIGRDLEIREPATRADAVRTRFPNGAPQALADAVIEGFELMRTDTIGFRTDTVKRMLGRKPRTFEDWCTRHVAAFQQRTTA